MTIDVNHAVNRAIHWDNLLLLYHVLADVMQIQVQELYVDQYFEENMFCFDSKKDIIENLIFNQQARKVRSAHHWFIKCMDDLTS